VTGTGGIASFSSRGPTADGRIKPEVCARGVSTASATSEADDTYGWVNGTSLSTPLVAGVACLLVQARPTFPPQLIRQALMETADNADAPDNTYGWGVVNAAAAVEWGTDFSADVTVADAPVMVQFSDESPLPATSRLWSFGDGTTSTELNPAHYYGEPGAYDVTLTITTDYGDITKIKRGYVIAMADTMRILSDSGFAGEAVSIPVYLTNSMELARIVVPFYFGDALNVTLDSTTAGSRTSYFESVRYISQDPVYNRYAVELKADDGGGSPPLAPGSGEIANFHFSINRTELGGLVNEIDTTVVASQALNLVTEYASFTPRFSGGSLASKNVMRGDPDRSMQIDISDITYMVVYFFEGGPPPVTVQAGDVSADGATNITDLTYLVDYLFNGGPPPVNP
jgi:PKD repeat protein